MFLKMLCDLRAKERSRPIVIKSLFYCRLKKKEIFDFDPSLMTEGSSFNFCKKKKAFIAIGNHSTEIWSLRKKCEIFIMKISKGEGMQKKKQKGNNEL